MLVLLLPPPPPLPLLRSAIWGGVPAPVVSTNVSCVPPSPRLTPCVLRLGLPPHPARRLPTAHPTLIKFSAPLFLDIKLTSVGLSAGRSSTYSFVACMGKQVGCVVTFFACKGEEAWRANGGSPGAAGAASLAAATRPNRCAHCLVAAALRCLKRSPRPSQRLSLPSPLCPCSCSSACRRATAIPSAGWMRGRPVVRACRSACLWGAGLAWERSRLMQGLGRHRWMQATACPAGVLRLAVML